jgi:hypothetical protein
MNVVINGLDLTDGKKVLLLAPDELAYEDMLELREILTDKFPESEFFIMNGGMKVIAHTNGPVDFIEGD